MEIEGHVLTQSASICEFIEEFFPDTKPVLPSDVYKRAVVREICNLLGTYIQPLQSPIIAGRIAQKYAENDQKHAFIMADWTPGIIVEGFQVGGRIFKKFPKITDNTLQMIYFQVKLGKFRVS